MPRLSVPAKPPAAMLRSRASSVWRWGGDLHAISSPDAVQVEVFRQHYADIYMALDQQPSPLFDGVAESLEAFRADGYRLAVATGKARRGLDRVLKANGWERYFDITRAADETRGKPHPLMLEQILAHCQVEPHQALMVGDSAFDLQMASNAGMHSVAVGYGAMSLQALSEFGPQVCIDHFHSCASGSLVRARSIPR